MAKNELSTSALRADTSALLASMSAKNYLKGFRLVGGTALAMYLQHRESIDLDLFTIEAIERELLKIELAKDYDLEIIGGTRVSLNALINGVKVDLIHHPYPTIEKAIAYYQIEVASLPDICAMKLNAAVGRGSKKDFIDIFFLLKQFSLDQMLAWYLLKYPNTNQIMVLKRLAYFTDAENQLMPRMNKPLAWEVVKNNLEQTVKKYLKKL
jgi:predicted nucleotidyltransferase component of viral defense system